MKPDVLICWPKDIYYPLFVYTLNFYRIFFNRVIIIITEGNLKFDFTNEIKKRVNEAIVLTPDLLKLCVGGKDWRNEAINFGYQYIVSPIVLFLEQDFLVKDNFFEDLLSQKENFKTIGFIEGNRLHPACLLTTVQAVEKTSRDFSAHPPEGDHFAKFTKELQNLGNWMTFQDLDIKGWYHMAGLTHNFRLKKGYYKLEEFSTYNKLAYYLNQPNEWKQFCRKKVDNMGEHKIDLNVKSYFDEINGGDVLCGTS